MKWFFALTKVQRSAVIGASAGWGVDGLDFMLYAFVIPTLMATWHMPHSEAGLIATGALVSSAVGGWLAGFLADRWGRVKVLQITILWFSVCTFLSGFTSSFAELFVIRTLQGFGFGGEWAVGAVLVSEMVEARYRGRAVGLMQSGFSLGWGLATIAFMIVFSLLPPQFAWRALFFVGILPALLVIYLRAKVIEPPIFVAAWNSGAAQRKTFAFDIFSRALIGRVALASLLAVGLQGAYYSVVTWLPTYLNMSRHMSILETGGTLLVLIAGSAIGYNFGASAMDRFGRRKALIAFACLTAVTTTLYLSSTLPPALIMLSGFPLGFTVSAMISGVGAFMAELFPTRVRGTAQGFSYNFGRLGAAAIPPLIGVLSETYSLPLMMTAFTVGSVACVVIAALLLPETRGRELEAIAE